MSFFVDAITGFLKARDVDEVTYVGVSMGGQVGLALALEAPERMRRLGLVSPAGIEPFMSEEAAALKEAMTPADIVNSTDEQVRQSVALNSATWSDDYNWLLEQRHALSERDDFEAYATANARSVAGMLDGDVRDRLGEIDVPTLVLFGAGDNLIPNQHLHEGMTTMDVAERAEETLSNAKVQVVDGAGHLLMLERPNRFRRAFRSFLND